MTPSRTTQLGVLVQLEELAVSGTCYPVGTAPTTLLTETPRPGSDP